ncbi:uncharacterized protein FOMMEDRAFT_148612 [Fomitiporia mediterranea MF3/22]|uniref:uncharacterized protein n=1 Tax=Fomitiporia mediterranea (strain MF3/22) TaxID=694068 RepID=UPI0004407770|nr:uncharacterized protein FOMMEDRAFT_148612 [Fomitiporia mediterranea MF3/22]EJC99776.1 hypothetical protein FOMMEDRAFT_148612 [Fomitiporia mediterranea MF3/22]
METINCLIGDCIVAWRAWILAGRGCKVLIIPVLFILGGTASSIGLTIAFSNEPSGHEIFSQNIFDWLVPFFAFTIATNLYAVAVISYKTWRHRQSMKALEKNGSRIFESGRFRIAMLLLIESGFLYILVLAVILVLFLLDSNGVYVVADMLAHLTGIYPVVIIVLVVLQLTQHDIASREATLSTMHFNVVSRIPARNMTHELSTLRIQVNSTNSFDSSRSPMEKGGEPKKCVRLEDFHYASA